MYVDYAQRMLELKNEAYRIIHDLAGQRRGTLTLAFAPERGWRCSWTCTPAFTGTTPR